MSNGQESQWSATEKDGRNQRRIVVWSLTWVLAFLAADFAIEAEWIGSGAPTIAVVTGITLLGLGALLAFRRFLRDADELMRKIQLDSLALTVGVGFVFGFGYSLLDSAAIVAQAEAMSLVMVMVATYTISVTVGLRRYS